MSVPVVTSRNHSSFLQSRSAECRGSPAAAAGISIDLWTDGLRLSKSDGMRVQFSIGLVTIALSIFGCGDSGVSVDGGIDGATDGGDAGSDLCDANPCMNGGVCSVVAGAVSCDCSGTGYQGDSCEADIDECGSGLGSCDARGASACTNDVGSFACTCNQGYDGILCETCVSGYVDDPVNPGVCIVDSCGLDPCDVSSGAGESCTVTGVDAYVCMCNGNYDSAADCLACITGFDDTESGCICDNTMGSFGDGEGGCVTCTAGSPTSGLSFTPTSVTAAATVEDLATGIRLTSGSGDLYTDAGGLGSDGVAGGSLFSFSMGESVIIEFFEEDGGVLTTKRSGRGVSVSLSGDSAASVQITGFDTVGNSLATSSTTVGGGTIDISAELGAVNAHGIALSAVGEPWQLVSVSFDHECL